MQQINFAEIGTRIVEIRRSRGISQEALASLAGISRTYLSNIESGRNVPGIDVLVSIASSLDVDLGALLSINGQVLSLLNDCSNQERIVLTENLRSLKETLRENGLTRPEKK